MIGTIYAFTKKEETDKTENGTGKSEPEPGKAEDLSDAHSGPDTSGNG